MKMSSISGRSLTAIGLSVMTAVGVVNPASANTPTTGHLAAAQEIVTQLDTIGWPAESAYNQYNSLTGGTVTWGTPGQPTTYNNNSQCAPFVTQSVQHAYSWARGSGSGSFFYTYFNANSPTSASWYYGLKYGKRTGPSTWIDVPHFETVNSAREILPGDVLAIQYGTGTGSPTGHTAIIESSEVWDDTSPTTTVFRVKVLDSTSNPHGLAPAGDTRSVGYTEYNGAGSGYMLLYADKASGAFTGSKWGVNEGGGSYYPNVETSAGRPFIVSHVTD
ncbi:hypothetical protein [Streptomyces sp. NPDC057675]|uniref:hypothetical protein n=1 Tax=Streptomyces sp. NPDC057675 TaxID=3346204 RepID=UPI0036AC3B04